MYGVFWCLGDPIKCSNRVTPHFSVTILGVAILECGHIDWLPCADLTRRPVAILVTEIDAIIDEWPGLLVVWNSVVPSTITMTESLTVYGTFPTACLKPWHNDYRHWENFLAFTGPPTNFRDFKHGSREKVHRSSSHFIGQGPRTDGFPDVCD